jgi:hypothetical protein
MISLLCIPKGLSEALCSVLLIFLVKVMDKFVPVQVMKAKARAQIH